MIIAQLANEYFEVVQRLLQALLDRFILRMRMGGFIGKFFVILLGIFIKVLIVVAGKVQLFGFVYVFVGFVLIGFYVRALYILDINVVFYVFYFLAIFIFFFFKIFYYFFRIIFLIVFQ